MSAPERGARTLRSCLFGRTSVRLLPPAAAPARALPDADVRDLYPEPRPLGEAVYRAVLEAVASCGPDGCGDRRLGALLPGLPQEILSEALRQLGEDRMVRHELRRPRGLLARLLGRSWQARYSLTRLGLAYVLERGYDPGAFADARAPEREPEEEPQDGQNGTPA